MSDLCTSEGSVSKPEGAEIGHQMECSICGASLLWHKSGIPVLLRIPFHDRGEDQHWIKHDVFFIVITDGLFDVRLEVDGESLNDEPFETAQAALDWIASDT